MTWRPLDKPVDYVVLAGQRSPGLASLEGWGSPRQWDKRRGYGLSGSTLVFRGVDLAEGQLVLRLTTTADFDAWEAWRPLVDRPPSGERPRALDISHPILDELGVRSVVVKNVAQPKQTADGEWTITIDLLEWRPPQPALARPDGSDDNAAEAEQMDAVDLEIEALRTQVDVLGAEVPG